MDFKIQQNISSCEVCKIMVKRQVNKKMSLQPFQNIEISDCSCDRMCMQKVYHQEANLHFRNNPGHLTSESISLILVKKIWIDTVQIVWRANS